MAFYASPEQSVSKVYGPRSDVFSLGLVFLELLCDFETEHERADGFATVRNERRVPESSRPTWCGKLVLDMTERDEKKRPNAAEVRTALDDGRQYRRDARNVDRLQEEIVEKDVVIRKQRDLIEEQDKKIKELQNEIGKCRLE